MAVAESLQANVSAQRRPPRWILLVLLGLVVVMRGRSMLALQESLSLDPDSYRELAYSLRHDGSLAWWIGPRLEPTAFRPPLYPLLIAPLAPYPPSAIGVAQVILGVVTVWATWRLAHSWGLPWTGALVAAALVAVDPILIHQSAQVMTETLAACLASLTLLALTRWARDGAAPWSVLTGLLLALCILCRPTFVVWTLAVLVALPFCARLPWRRALVAGIVLLGMVTAALAPWAIRNVWQFGAPVFTTTHGGYTLMLANNPDFYEYLRSAPWGSTWDAERFNARWSARSQSNRLASGNIDEVDNDRLAYATAWENIRHDPLMFAWASAVRVGWLWGVLPHQLSPDESPSRRGARWAVAIWYVLEFLLAAAGAWCARSQLFAAPWIWGVLLVVAFSAAHALFWTDMRMRAPLVPVVALLAARGMAMLAARRRSASPSIA